MYRFSQTISVTVKLANFKFYNMSSTHYTTILIQYTYTYHHIYVPNTYLFLYRTQPTFDDYIGYLSYIYSSIYSEFNMSIVKHVSHII